ncbi:HNH endonuclease [Bradyrhizobium sp. WSM 4400]|nr:HNH endonuclease [Bradyrhizobium australafricanum]
MKDLMSLEGTLPALNRQFLQQRMAVEPNHRRFMARKRKAPNRRVIWDYRMPDDVPRECQYCGEMFLPNLDRRVGLIAAPPSVEEAHRRAHCGTICDMTYLAGLRSVKINRERIFESANWRCYLCDQLTPPDLRGFAYRPNAPSIDHIVPKGCGTDEADNLRCCCRLCNLEKGTAALWNKISIYVSPPDIDVFPEVLASILPRQPTLEDLVQLWRTNFMFEGKRVDVYDQNAFLKFYNLLSSKTL